MRPFLAPSPYLPEPLWVNVYMTVVHSSDAPRLPRAPAPVTCRGVADKKTTVLAIRVSDTDKGALEAEARRLGVPTATLCRDLLLTRKAAENSVKPPETAILKQNSHVYHIDDLGEDDELRHYTPSLRT